MLFSIVSLSNSEAIGCASLLTLIGLKIVSASLNIFGTNNPLPLVERYARIKKQPALSRFDHRCGWNRGTHARSPLSTYMASAAAIKTAPAQKRQSRCILLQ
jgi:hypothetical protein